MQNAPGSSLFLTRPAAWIEVSGEDAPTFLQSQFSADVRVGVGSAVAGLWLDHRARIHGESVVLHVGEEKYIIASLSTPAAGLLEKLEGHVIADDVDFVDRTEAVGCLLLWGGTRPCGPGPVAAGQFVYRNSTYAHEDLLGRERVFVMVGPEGDCREIYDTMKAEGACEWTSLQWAAWRMHHLRPMIPREIGPGETPGDVGLGRLCSLSKGCYLGQEVVNRQARLERFAQSLCRVRVDGLPTIEPGVALGLVDDEGTAVGSLRAGVALETGFFGLALLKNKYRKGPILLDDETHARVEVLDG